MSDVSYQNTFPKILFASLGIDCLALIIIIGVATAIRIRYFIGFGLGDDLGYFSLINNILNGHWVEYHYLNQYAYRPLLLLSVAASFKIFGISDMAFVLPVFISAIGNIGVAYCLGSMFFNRRVGLLSAILLAFYPFNVFNSVTFDNDVIIAFITGISVLLFFRGRSAESQNQGKWYAAAGVCLAISYLFKMTSLVFLGVFGLFSAVEILIYKRHFRQIYFFGSFFLFFFLILCFYKIQTGEFLRHFYAERIYYDTNIPDFYLSGAYRVSHMLLQYPRHMFLPITIGNITFFEFGLYVYLFMISLIPFLWKERGSAQGLFLILWLAMVFSFLEFMPSNWDPFYLPIPRQERYLEIITLPLLIIICWFLVRVYGKSRLVFFTMLVSLILSSVVQTHIRCDSTQRSIADLKRVSEWLCENNAREIYVDIPGLPHIAFFTHECNTKIFKIEDAYEKLPGEGAFVISGGGRMYLWDPALIHVLDKHRIGVEVEKVLAYESEPVPRGKGPLELYQCVQQKL